MNYYGSKPIKQYVKLFNIFEALNFKDESFSFGWGRKKSYVRANHYAEKNKIPLVCLEDGFVRSLGLGKNGFSPLSLVVDRTGIYFDALQPSDLENLILQPELEDWNKRAQANIQQIRKYQITKYNQKFDFINELKFVSKHNILVVDQTFGDQSIHYSGASVASFKNMLCQAITNHPKSIIWVKVHPDVLAKKSKGHFEPEDLRHSNIKLLTENYNPMELLSYMDEVYVVSSQLGFEALLCGKRVHCFGLPWYAGWGLTLDEHAPNHLLGQRRHQNKSIEHLFACAYLKYALYVSPITQERCELENILDLLIPNISFQKSLGQDLVAYGFSPWKKKFIKSYLNFPTTKLQFKNLFKPKKNDVVVAWGKKAHLLKNKGYENIITVEDGFIRSIGLGAKLIRPCSLVFDPVGIYYDATKPSRLENLLNNGICLTKNQENRAKDLVRSLIDLNITKYNVGQLKRMNRPNNHQKVILVVGQVEDDMSIQLGGVGIKTNLELLKEVRLNNQYDYIIYKPHPDVQEGLRIGYIKDSIINKYADHIEINNSILECFNICDELHTISSLSGFEALIRGIKVVCYGLPFYAGWGLTTDKFNCKRRTAKINLEKLVYMTLVEYATYNLPSTLKMNISLVNPEDIILFIKNSRKIVKY